MENAQTKVVKIVGKGRGVIAKKRIREGSVVEECPVLLFERKTSKHMLQEYCFRWSPTQVALPLGFGSLYNHSYTPNVYCVQNTRRKTISIVANRTIKAGEEIMFDYTGGAPDTKVWFDAK